MRRVYVDTNVILRFITGSPADQTSQAKRLFGAAERGEVSLVLDEIVLAESVWVLSSLYKFSKDAIRDVLQVIIASPGIEMKDEMGALLALTLYADLNVDFEDALISVHMGQDGIEEIYTFDKHFNRLPGVKPLPPGGVQSND
jgi:predicted nucleic-acid-binding protein